MAQPRKILWISCVGEKGGAEVYLLNFLRHLDRRRFAPSVVLLRPGPLADELKALDVPVHGFAAHRMRHVWNVGLAILKLARLIRDEGASLVHSNGFRAHTYGGLAAQLAGVPEIWNVFTVEKDGLYTSANLRIPTAHTIAICPPTADYFIARGCPTSMIWPSIDPQRLSLRAPRASLAQRYKIPVDAQWVAMGARLQRYKGHAFFIRALAALPPEMHNVHAVILGGTLFGMEPSYPDELKSLAASLGVAARVHFPGFVPDEDLYGFVAESELVVHPALEEDFGLIVAEAQGLGRPVLAFASVGPAAIIDADKTGRLVETGNQDKFSAALADLLAAPNRLREWGDAGRERALRLFDAREATRQLERIYASCLNPVPDLNPQAVAAAHE
ncbi:MAG: glycosyltransferase family 4 protein [Verrucomicrobiota bacterium]